MSDEADGAGAGDAALGENDGQRFARLPAVETDREVAGRPSREAVLSFWEERYGVPRETFADHTFWEKGAGKVWAFSGEATDPSEVQALGMTFLRTRQEHWKPTTDAVQRFGRAATENVVALSPGEADRFLAGEDQELDWDGDWGYLIAAREVDGVAEPVGVGLYLYGELRSVVPKGRQRERNG